MIMHIMRRWLIHGFIVLLILMVLLHLGLLYGLSWVVKKTVLPQVASQLDVEVCLGRLSVNLPAGLVVLRDIKISNLEDFIPDKLAIIPYAEIKVEVGSLFTRNPLMVRHVYLKNGEINLVRNRQGVLNFHVLQKRLSDAAVGTEGIDAPPEDVAPDMAYRRARKVPTKEAPARAGYPAKPVEIRIEKVICTANVRYLDMRLPSLDLLLNMDLIAEGLSTESDPAAPWASVRLTGGWGVDRNGSKANLSMHLAPVTDTEALSFDLTGRIMGIDPRLLGDASKKLGIGSSPFGVDLRFHCRAGQLESSHLTVNLRDVNIASALGYDDGHVPTQALQFSVPIEGSLKKPKINIAGALQSAIRRNAPAFLGALLEGAAEKVGGFEQPVNDLKEAATAIIEKGLGLSGFGNEVQEKRHQIVNPGPVEAQKNR